MQYTTLGPSGLVVSRLAFGTMTFSHSPGEGRMPAVYKVEQAQADEIIGVALAGGINFFNSADVYSNGDSEEILGKALGRRRGEAVIATKVGGRGDGHLLNAGLSRRHIVASVDGSLRRLQTDWIDLYLFHRTDPFTPMDEVLEAMESVIRQGKVRYAGVSNWEPWRVAKAVQYQADRGYARFIAGEYYYSLIGREIETDLVPMALDCGMGLMPWSPLASGLLSGKYTREDPTGGGGRRTGFGFPRIEAEEAFRVTDALRAVASARSATCAQVALAWLLAKPAVASIIISATSTDQLQDNLGSASLVLSADEMTLLDELMPPHMPLLASIIRNGGDALLAEKLAHNS